MATKPTKFSFVAGGDDFLVDRKAQEIYSGWTAEVEDDFAKEVIDGTANNLEGVEKAFSLFSSAVQTMPMFGDRKFVWFRGVTFLADSVTGRAEGTIKLLEQIQRVLEGINPEEVKVVISASPVDRRRSFPKWCEANGDSFLVGDEKNKADMLLTLMRQECEKMGVGIDADAAQLLVGMVNGNTRLVIEEIRKLSSYIAGEDNTIRERYVREMVPTFGESEFFEVAEAFFANDLKWTLDAIRRYFFTNKEARPIIATLQNRNRLAIQLRALLDSRDIALTGRGLAKGSLDTAGSKYGQFFEQAGKSGFNVFSQNPWYLGRIAEEANRFSLKQLISFQSEFVRAFRGLISNPNDQDEVLREMAVRCLG